MIIDTNIAVAETYAMGKIGDILKEMRMRSGLEQVDVARKLGMNAETVSRWERSSRLPKRGSAMARMAELYGSSLREVVDQWHREGDRPGKSTAVEDLKAEISRIPPGGTPGHFDTSTAAPSPEHDIPILAGAPAGGMSKPRQLGDAIGTIPRALYPNDSTAFGIVVEGDSMSPWVNNNDLVIASKHVRVEDGMPCVVCAREGFELHCDTIKYVTQDNGRLKLVPANPAHRPMWVDADQVWCYPIVVRVFRDYIRMGIKPMELPLPARSTAGEERQVFPNYEGTPQISSDVGERDQALAEGLDEFRASPGPASPNTPDPAPTTPGRGRRLTPQAKKKGAKRLPDR
jgi:SOS-response transcriptional repressor LexA